MPNATYIRQTFNAQGCLLDESRLELRPDANPDRVLYFDAPPLPPCGARHTFQEGRPGYRPGCPLPVPSWARRRRPGPAQAQAPLETLASQAAAHYRARRAALPPDQVLEVPVFPVGKTASSTSWKFRELLANHLTDAPRRGHGYHYDPVRFTLNRVEAEARLAAAGYAFVEVDPAAWFGAPDPLA